MKKITLSLIAALALVVGLSAQSSAQTAVTTTTVSAAVTATQNTVTLASGTNVGVGSELYLDQEALVVLATTGAYTTTNPRVSRGQDGSSSSSHASGATVYVAPVYNGLPGPFWQSDPPIGSCVAANEAYSLRIVARTGRIWKCVTSQWQTVANASYAAVMPSYRALGTAIASATTIAPVAFVTHVTGTTGIATITVPDGCGIVCQIVLIPDGLWSTTNAGNIAIATTGVVSKALILTFDAAANKWYPSY